MKMMKLILCLLFISTTTFTEIKYQRKQWGGWSDPDKNCQNTRHEILAQRSLVPVTFKDKKNCKVLSGQWADFYHEATYTQAQEVDIDHVVPLFEAHKSGGASWDKKKKRVFANDQDNLVITSSRINKQKSAHSLKSWLPVQKEYACRYYEKWMFVKRKYDLSISEDEIKAVDISSCVSKKE